MCYRMAQNFDGGNFDEWAFGKFGQNFFDEFHNVNTHIY